MPIQRAIEGIDWFRKIEEAFGKERFFCTGSDCKATPHGYSRLHALNVHMMPRHNKRASKLPVTRSDQPHHHVGNQSTRIGARKTRSATLEELGRRLKGKRIPTPAESNRAHRPQPNRQRRSACESNKLHYAALLDLKKCLQKSVKAISRVMQKSKAPQNKKRCAHDKFSEHIRNFKSVQRNGTASSVTVVGTPHNPRAPSPATEVPLPMAVLSIESEQNPEAFASGPNVSPTSPEMWRSPLHYRHKPLACPTSQAFPITLVGDCKSSLCRTTSGPYLLDGIVDGGEGDINSPGSEAVQKTPPTVSKVDRNCLLITAWRSVREVIQIDDDETAIPMYDVDRPCPFRARRGSSTHQPIVLDSPQKIAAALTQSVVDSDVDIKPALGLVEGALNLEWDGLGKCTFLLPILGKECKGKQQLFKDPSSPHVRLYSPPSATGFVKELGESSIRSAFRQESSGSPGLSDLLAKVDTLSRISLPCPTPGKVVHCHGEVNCQSIGLPAPTDLPSQLCNLDSQLMEHMVDDWEDPSDSDAEVAKVVDYATDTGSD